MSTLDVVAHAGGAPANFLDAGGGSNAEKIRQAVELLLANEAVKAVLFNIFGGITRCDEVALGLIEAFEQIKPDVPFVVRLDGTNDVEGRRLLQEAALPNVHAAKTMNEAAEMVVALAAGRPAWERAPDVGPRRRGHAPGGGRHHRPRGELPHAQQPHLRDQRGRRRDPRQGRPGRRGDPRVRQLAAGDGRSPSRTRR